MLPFAGFGEFIRDNANDLGKVAGVVGGITLLPRILPAAKEIAAYITNNKPTTWDQDNPPDTATYTVVNVICLTGAVFLLKEEFGMEPINRLLQIAGVDFGGAVIGGSLGLMGSMFMTGMLHPISISVITILAGKRFGEASTSVMRHLGNYLIRG